MIRATLIIVISLGTLGLINGQDDPTSLITGKLNEIAKTQGLNITDFEKGAEDAKKILKNKCEKNGGPDAFDNANNAKDDLSTCMQNLVNVTTLQEEIRIAGPTGDVDLVFKKYCDKKPQFTKCMTNFMDKLSPCLEQSEKDNFKTVKTAMESLFDFICHKEGERIALFISVGGPECIIEKRPTIQNCLNSTYGGNITFPLSGLNTASIDTLPAISFGPTECNHMENLRTCVVKSLEECKDTTPGNMADALFKFVKNSTPCKNIITEKMAKAEAHSGASQFNAAIKYLPFLIISTLGRYFY